jgi:soluble lytic murein transglycosylase-like protein
MNIPSWRVLIKLAFMRILCREYYERHVHLEKSICLQCGCKMLAGIFIIGAMIFFPSYASLAHSEQSRYRYLHIQYPLMKYEWYAVICEQATRRGLDVAFICALINEESHWNPTKPSCVGARGLMQVMPFNYKGNTLDLDNPRINITEGTRILAEAHRAAKGNLTYTLRNYERGRYGRGLNVNYTAKIEQNLRGTI